MKIELENIQKAFREHGGNSVVRALDGVSLEIGSGEVVALVGPSGCGKTTLLRTIAGLETADSGVVRVGDRVLLDRSRRIDVPPDGRSMGMVFQSYALWPHMSVERNIEFPLRCQRWPKEKRRAAVAAALQLVGCAHLGKRHPAQLSGGQQQRVALARAVVAEPDVVLFDEPLSNLDARLRDELRFEIRALQTRLGITGVYVTHDRSEAWVVADRLAVMSQGRLLQLGPANEVAAKPKNVFVAEFIGDMNVLRGKMINSTSLEWQAATFNGRVVGDPVGVGDAGGLCIAPSNLSFYDPGHDPSGAQFWRGTVIGGTRTPQGVEVYAKLVDGTTWKVLESHDTPLPEVGAEVRIAASIDDCLLLPLDPATAEVAPRVGIEETEGRSGLTSTLASSR